jgi:hypothetical protein
VGDLVALPMTDLRSLATVFQQEERAFEVVLDVLREGGRFDLLLKLQTFHMVRQRRVLRLLMERVRGAVRPNPQERVSDAAANEPAPDSPPGPRDR